MDIITKDDRKEILEMIEDLSAYDYGIDENDANKVIDFIISKINQKISIKYVAHNDGSMGTIKVK